MADLPTEAEPLQVAPKAPPPGFSSNAIHLVRTTQQINLALSQMADAKSSILMGATFLVFTIAVGQARSGALPWSLGILAIFAFGSAMFAVFAVLPSVSAPTTSGVDDKQVNKLFFGHFAHLDEEAWTASVLTDLRSEEAMYRLMLHDIYQNGKVLQRKKYKYLAYAYKTFMIGLTLTAITFAFELLLA